MKKNIQIFLGVILLVGIVLIPHVFAQDEVVIEVAGTDLRKAVVDAPEGATLKIKKGVAYNRDSGGAITINKDLKIIGDDADNNSKATIYPPIIIKAGKKINVTLKNYNTDFSGDNIKGDYKFIDVQSPVNLNLDGVYIWNIYRKHSDDDKGISLNLAEGSDSSLVNIDNTYLDCYFDGIHVLSDSNTINIKNKSRVAGTMAINYDGGNGNVLNINNDSIIEGLTQFNLSEEAISINNQTNLKIHITDTEITGSDAKAVGPPHLISLNDGNSTGVEITIDGKSKLTDNNTAKGGNLFDFGTTKNPSDTNFIKLGKDVTLSPSKLEHKYNDSTNYGVVGIYDVDGASTIKAYKKGSQIPDKDFPSESIDGYRFEGWFKDKDKTIDFVKTSSINENLDIYPKYIKLVKVDIGGTTYELDENQNLGDLKGAGETALEEFQKPSDGKGTFDHFEDEDGNTIEMNTPITKDITLKAIFKIKVTIDKDYDLEKGKTLDDLISSNDDAKTALDNLKNVDKDNKDFKSYVAGGKDIDTKTAINEDTKVTARYSVKITVGEDQYEVDENSKIESLNGDVKTALDNLKTVDGKDFANYVDESGAVVEENTPITKHTTIKGKYTIKLKIGGTDYNVADGITLSKLENDAKTALDALNLSNKKLIGYVDGDGKAIDINTPITKHTTIQGKYNVVITIEGEKYEIGEGKTLNDLSSLYAKALVFLNKIRSASNKTFLYFVNSKGNEVKDNTPINENTTISGKYNVNVNIGGTDYPVSEGTKLSELSGGAKIAFDALEKVAGKRLSKRVDGEGNEIDLNQKLHQHIKIVGKYEIDITIGSQKYTIEDGQTLNNLNESGKQQLETLEKETTKKFDHYEDKTGQKIEKSTKLTKHTIITPKYLIEITISGKKYYVNENENLSNLNSEGKKALESLKNVDKNIKKFEKLVDEKGNPIEEDAALTHNLEIKGLYKVTITIDNQAFDIYENETLDKLSGDGKSALDKLKTPSDGNGTWKRWQDQDGKTIDAEKTKITKNTTITPIYTINVTIDKVYELEKGKTLEDLISSNNDAKEALKKLEKNNKILVGYKDIDNNEIKKTTKIKKDVTIKGIYEVEITIGNKKFRLSEGKKLNDLSKDGKQALDELKNTKNKTFVKYVDGNGNGIDFEKEIHHNMIVKGVYKITVTINNQTYTLDEGQTIDDLPSEAKQELTKLQNQPDKSFSRFVFDGKTIDNNTKLYQNTTIIPKYNIKVTINDQTFELEEGLTLNDLYQKYSKEINKLKTPGTNQKFMGFKNPETDKIVKDDEVIDQDITLEPVFEKVTVKEPTNNNKKENIKNPITLDSIGNYIIIGIFSLLSIVGLNFKKIKKLMK